MSVPLTDSRRPRYFAWTRMFTACTRHMAYIYDRETNRVVAACSHIHRSRASAQSCAEGMLRRFLRERAEGLEPSTTRARKK